MTEPCKIHITTSNVPDDAISMEWTAVHAVCTADSAEASIAGALDNLAQSQQETDANAIHGLRTQTFRDDNGYTTVAIGTPVSANHIRQQAV